MRKNLGIGFRKVGTALISYLTSGSLILLAMPASTNFKLNDYSIGGGAGSGNSSHYNAEGQSGEQTSTGASAGTHSFLSGLFGTQQAAVPAAPTLDNTGSYYNKLHFVITPGSNPSDTEYAVAVSTDNFVTTKYLAADDTLGSTLSAANYQTYAQWGGSTGEYIIGLSSSTTYAIKVKAYRGAYTDSAYGPTASAATSAPTLSLSLATDTQSIPPFSIAFGAIPVGSVTSSPQKIIVSFATNGQSGGGVYVASANGGLKSTASNYLIASSTGDLSSLSEGFGAQSFAVTQSTGGPLAAVSPYNGSSTTVGALASSPALIFSSSAAITGGQGSFYLKAKTSSSTPSATDYTDTVILTASAGF